MTNEQAAHSTIARLITAAQKARENAFAPYSNFRVGAAIETVAGEIYAGCNIENATYGLTLCAERVAIFKAVSEARREFRHLAIVADTDVAGTERLTPPCGACRQIIWEFCGDITITLANLRGQSQQIQMSKLLPHAFDRTFLS